MSVEDWKYIFLLVKVIWRKDKKRIISMMVLAFAEIINKYISIILLGRIVDCLSLNTSMQEFLKYVTFAFGLIFVCKIIEFIACCSFTKKLDYTKDIETEYMNKKAMDFYYEFLEKPEISDLRYRSFSKSYYGIAGWNLLNVKLLIEGVISMIITVFIVTPLFQSISMGQHNFLFAWTGTGLLLLLVIIFTGVNYKTGIYYTRRAKKELDVAGHCYNKKQYYMDKFSDTEFQKDVRISKLQKLVINDLDKLFTELKEREYRYGEFYVKRQRVAGGLTGLSSCIVYLYVGMQVFRGMISIGEVIIIASGILQFSRQMITFASTLGNMKSVALFSRDYLDFMSLGEQKEKRNFVEDKALISKNNLLDFQGDHKSGDGFTIKFENVSFCYPGEKKYALKDVNVCFSTKEKLAIVGRNGSGKTTFIKLLCGFYQGYEGRILVNDIEIREYKLEEYWKFLSVVFQDFHIFNLSVKENFGERQEEKKIKEALERAGLEGIDLEDKVGQTVYPYGKNFSGGEKQKIAIARSIYKAANIIIMDEPTAALDPIAENEIFAGFDNLIGSSGGIYISHRLSSCRFCQKILVLNGGCVVQQGSHDKLMQEQGEYRELWNAQRKFYELN